jgi:xylulokinase
MSLYLGLDSSTQSLTAIVVRVDGNEREVVFERSLRFDEDFPHYGTRHGVLAGEDPLIAHGSPAIWADALDALIGSLRDSGLRLDDLRAIAGSAQQHGSVYLNEKSAALLANLDPARPLADQVIDMLSRPTAPIWMDSSTRVQCDAITSAVGGDERLAEITGSRAFERFTGPQIRKFWQQSRDLYEATRKIHLVSSFMASLLAGRDASIDPGDGSGMNLMDLAAKRWSPIALDATAPGLERRLPEIREAWHVQGPIGRYWVDRHGIPPGVKVVSWSGDNPCSLVGVGLIETGRVGISLGTSDTLFGYLPEPRIDPAGDGHTFGSPTGQYMSLLCFKNGSLAREAIRKRYGLDWEGFSRALRESRPGNDGRILLPWFEPEITPLVLEPGVRRYGIPEDEAASNVRGVVEAQLLAMAVHSRWMKVRFTAIHATGGAARNREILRVMADVLGADVFQFPVGNSAALGAAIRAFHADRESDGQPISWKEAVRGFAEPLLASRIAPDPSAVALYRELADIFVACENHALRGGPDPEPLLRSYRERHGC